MFRIIGIIILFLLITTGCNTEKKERTLRQREAALAKREQQILAREQELSLREADLAAKMQAADSSTTKADTLNAAPPIATGTWEVQMTCIETSCTGSAVGDTKTEQWELTNQNNTVVARATEKGQLVRVYTGRYNNGTLELSEERASAADPNLAQMLVRLTPISETKMEGQREIVRENNCRVVYALQLNAVIK